jgi:hypothetical protein
MDEQTKARLREALAELQRGAELMERRMAGVLTPLGDVYVSLESARRIVVELIEVDEAEPLTLVRAEQTCFGCPSQWDAWDEAGNQYYLRFRHGCGTVSLRGRMQDGVVEWLDRGDPIASFETGDAYDGIISLPEFAAKAGIRLGGTMAGWSQ